jgi:hypothetical protein
VVPLLEKVQEPASDLTALHGPHPKSWWSCAGVRSPSP